MKTLKKSILIAFIALTSQLIVAQSWNKSKIKGNGNVTTKTVSASDYDHIHVTGSMDVTLVHGDEGTITVKTDENLHEHLEISSNGNTLTISVKKDRSHLFRKLTVNG